jgi:hypothetical protein
MRAEYRLPTSSATPNSMDVPHIAAKAMMTILNMAELRSFRCSIGGYDSKPAWYLNVAAIRRSDCSRVCAASKR